jgi:hypothetical protein
MSEQSNTPKQAPKKTFRTSLSIPRTMYQAASRKASNDRRSFSGYVQLLIERDLGRKACV